MTHKPKPHDHPHFDGEGSTHTPPPARLPYPSLDDAVLAGDFATADAYFAHENRTAFWLDSMIVMRKEQAARYDPALADDPWKNNKDTAERGAKLATALEVYKAHRG
jgi:hypothetical protein